MPQGSLLAKNKNNMEKDLNNTDATTKNVIIKLYKTQKTSL